MSDYSELKRLAEAATPAPWQDDKGAVHAPESGKWPVDGYAASSYEDSAFIAAANPAVVLALIEEAQNLRKGWYLNEFGDNRFWPEEIQELKAEVEALRQQVANLSPFKGTTFEGPDLRCRACGGYHYGMENMPCPKMRAIAQVSVSTENQRIVPAPSPIAGPHPFDVVMRKEAG